MPPMTHASTKTTGVLFLIPLDPVQQHLTLLISSSCLKHTFLGFKWHKTRVFPHTNCSISISSQVNLLYLTIKSWSSSNLGPGSTPLSLHTQCLPVLSSMTLPQWPVNYRKMHLSSPDPSDRHFLLGVSKILQTQNVQSWIHDLPPQNLIYLSFMKPPSV